MLLISLNIRFSTPPSPIPRLTRLIFRSYFFDNSRRATTAGRPSIRRWSRFTRTARSLVNPVGRPAAEGGWTIGSPASDDQSPDLGESTRPQGPLQALIEFR